MMQYNWKEAIKTKEFKAEPSDWESMQILLAEREKTKSRPMIFWWLAALLIGSIALSLYVYTIQNSIPPADFGAATSQKGMTTEIVESEVVEIENNKGSTAELTTEDINQNQLSQTEPSFNKTNQFKTSEYKNPSYPVTQQSTAFTENQLENQLKDQLEDLFENQIKNSTGLHRNPNSIQKTIELATSQKELITFVNPIARLSQNIEYSRQPILLLTSLTDPIDNDGLKEERKRFGIYLNIENIFDGHTNKDIGDIAPNYWSLGLHYNLSSTISFQLGIYDYLASRRMGSSTYSGIVTAQGEFDHDLQDNPMEYIKGVNLGTTLHAGRLFIGGKVGYEQSSLKSNIIFTELIDLQIVRDESYFKTYESNQYFRFETLLGFHILRKQNFALGIHLRYSYSTNDFNYTLLDYDKGLDQFDPPAYWPSYDQEKFDEWKSRTDYSMFRDKKYSLSAGVNFIYYFK